MTWWDEAERPARLGAAFAAVTEPHSSEGSSPPSASAGIAASRAVSMHGRGCNITGNLDSRVIGLSAIDFRSLRRLVASAPPRFCRWATLRLRVTGEIRLQWFQPPGNDRLGLPERLHLPVRLQPAGFQRRRRTIGDRQPPALFPGGGPAPQPGPKGAIAFVTKIKFQRHQVTNLMLHSLNPRRFCSLS